MKIESNNVKERIQRLKDDYKHSITEENERFVSGLLYGLTMATGIIDAEVKAGGNYE